MELAGSDGNLAWIGQYRAWGKLTKATDGSGDPITTDNPFRFQGQYHDEETGLHYNRFRYYDPEIGRFTTQDPIELMGGANLYQYAPNPTGWVDPLGLSCSRRCGDVTENISLVNSRRPINSRYADSTHPSGVRFNEQGFPDFAPYSKAQVEINGLTGNYAKDSAMANKSVGLNSTPEEYVWHHVEDGKTMQLIPKNIHNAARHTGGAAVLRNQ